MGQLYTLTQPSVQTECRVRGSRFIARMVPATSRDEVSKIIREVRESLPGVTHICYAYRLMLPGDESRCTGVTPDKPEEFSTDAGEPGGSAGVPILNVLRRAGLVDVVAWVGRYFGGTKLGIPGLTDAYGKAAETSLQNEVSVPWVVMTGMRVVLPYPLVDRVKSRVQKVGGSILKEAYGQQAVLTLRVPQQIAEDFTDLLAEWGGGSTPVSIGMIDSVNE